jgi:flagellar P-ring protein FlgI
MAQGNVAVGGLGVTGRDGSQVTVNVATVGRIADGASVERAVASGFDLSPSLRFNLHKADFLTASRVRDAINARYPGVATIADGVSIELALPLGNDVRSALMAEIEMLAVTPAPVAARVIINSRTGTVVINDAVRLAPAAVSHGKLVIRIEESPSVVQPAPFQPRRDGGGGILRHHHLRTCRPGRLCAGRGFLVGGRRCAQLARRGRV